MRENLVAVSELVEGVFEATTVEALAHSRAVTIILKAGFS